MQRPLVAQRVALPFAAVAAVEPAPGQSYVVQRGNNLWRIAQHAYGAGTRYVIIYSANPEQICDPDRIYPGQIFDLRATQVLIQRIWRGPRANASGCGPASSACRG